MYRAKASLRDKGSPAYQGLYINDDLTPRNFQILMSLKNYRKSFSRDDDPFRSIYTRDGRVYVKLATDDPSGFGTHVKHHDFLASLKNGRGGQNPAAASDVDRTIQPPDNPS